MKIATFAQTLEGLAAQGYTDTIDKAEKETDDEAVSDNPREDVISASPDYSCEISTPFHAGYRIILRGFGKVAAVSPKDANGWEGRPWVK